MPTLADVMGGGNMMGPGVMVTLKDGRSVPWGSPEHRAEQQAGADRLNQWYADPKNAGDPPWVQNPSRDNMPPVFQPPQDGGFTGGQMPPTGGILPSQNNPGGPPLIRAPIPGERPVMDPAAFDEQLRQMYRQYLGRDATQQEIDGHRNNPQGLAGIFTQMQQDPSFRGLDRLHSQTFGTNTTALPNAGGAPTGSSALGAPRHVITGLGGNMAGAALSGQKPNMSKAWGAIWGAKPSWIQAGTVGASAENPWAKIGAAGSSAGRAISGGLTPQTQSGYAKTTQGEAEPASYDEWLNKRERGW